MLCLYAAKSVSFPQVASPTLDSGPETLDRTSLFWTSVPRRSRGPALPQSVALYGHTEGVRCTDANFVSTVRRRSFLRYWHGMNWRSCNLPGPGNRQLKTFLRQLAIASVAPLYVRFDDTDSQLWQVPLWGGDAHGCKV